MPKIVKEVKSETNSNTLPSTSSVIPPPTESVAQAVEKNPPKALSTASAAPPTDPPPIVDSHKKLQLIKSIQEFQDLVNNTSTELVQTIRPSLVSKKPINIPICDIREDEEYSNKSVTNYHLPVSYVKYVKNISDENDLTVDYNVDTEDENWLKMISTKLSLTDFSITKFEHLINVLEKANGNGRDTIIQSIALKALLEKSGCEQAFIYKILPDLYRYWVSKRDKQGKPLVRKYWPPVLATDTNPHQVFRVRDKERYRLRRHRRNDLESFRKMQQLRKEFVQAKTILQLILERELLHQGGFRIEREIFKKKLQEVEDTLEDSSFKNLSSLTTYYLNHALTDDPLSSSSNPVPSDPSSNPTNINNEIAFHEPIFKQLWFQSMNKSASCDNLYFDSSKTFDAEDIASVSENGTILSNKKSVTSEKLNHRNGKLSSVDDSKDLQRKSTAGTVGRKRKQKDKMVLYTLNKNGEVEIVNIDGTGDEGGSVRRRHSSYASTHHDTDIVIPYSGYSAPSILEVVQATFETGESTGAAVAPASSTSAPTTTVSVPRELRTIHEQLEGPKYVCNPQWPNFTQTLPSMRDQAVHQSSALEYLRDLELKTDDSGERHAPIKYRSRYRIGRGGRLIIDRIPIYNEGPDAEDTLTAPNIGYDWRNTNFQYPFLLQTNHNIQPPSSLLPAPTVPISSSSTNKTTTKANTMPLTINAIAQLNSENQLKAATAVASTTGPNTNTSTNAIPDQPLTATNPAHPLTTHLIAKPLPEIPLSNRRLLTAYKKNNPPKNLVSSYQWSNTLPNLFSTIPPMIPPPKPLLSQEKRKKLNEILAQSDSEDEKIVIPKSNSGIDVERNMTNKAVATEQAMTKFVFHV